MREKLIIMLLFVTFFSCQKDSPTSPEEEINNTDPIVSQLIGTNGGTLTSGNIQIVIPQNSFSESSQVKIYTNESFCGNESASDAYKIEGLPVGFKGSITVMLKPNSSQLIKHAAVMTDNIYGRGNKLSTVTNYLPVKDSNGFKVSQFSLAEQSFGKKLYKNNSATSSYSIQLSSTAEMTSTSGHFRIIYPTTLFTKAVSLAEYLEESYSKTSAMGFNIQTGFPLKVIIKKFSAEEQDLFGKYSHSFSLGEIEELNQDLLIQSNDFKATAAHEYFHFVQDKYDPRNIISKGNLAPQTLWLDEATAVWFESKILNNDNYISSARLENELAPYLGMHAEPGTISANGSDEHGYGMSAVIKYITSLHGNSIVKTIYDKIYAGSHPVEAIFIANPDPVSFWWNDFLTKYTLGQISSDMSLNKLLRNSYTESLSINQSTDTVYTFNSASKDLSGKLFNIILNSTSFEEGNNLTFSLTAPNFCDLTVFAYKDKANDKEIKLVEQNPKTVTISDLKNWKDQGYNFLGLVTNHQIKTPYSNTSNIKLELNLVKEEKPLSVFDISKIKYIGLHANVQALFEGYDGLEYLAKTVHKITNKNYVNSPINLTGNSAEFNIITTDSISISVTVDTTNGTVLSFHAAIKYFSGDRVILSGNNLPFFRFEEFNGKNIGYSSGISQDACSHISYFRWDYNQMKKYIELTCEGGNAPTIFISFLTENPGWL